MNAMSNATKLGEKFAKLMFTKYVMVMMTSCDSSQWRTNEQVRTESSILELHSWGIEEILQLLLLSKTNRELAIKYWMHSQGVERKVKTEEER